MLRYWPCFSFSARFSIYDLESLHVPFTQSGELFVPECRYNYVWDFVAFTAVDLQTNTTVSPRTWWFTRVPIADHITGFVVSYTAWSFWHEADDKRSADGFATIKGLDVLRQASSR